MKKTLFMNDADFYDEYVSKLSLEDQAKFFEAFPEFLQFKETISEELKSSIYDAINKLL